MDGGKSDIYPVLTSVKKIHPKKFFIPKLAGIWSMEHDDWYEKYT